MNYIKRLQREAKAKEARIQATESGLRELAAYLTSPKFRSGSDLDGYVNVQDVLDRIEGTRSAAETAELEALA
jgi:hypothetical protein